MELFINAIFRLLILYFLIEVLINPYDKRFEGKAIPVRNFFVVLFLSLAIPILYNLQSYFPNIIHLFSAYPFWIDNIYLSIFLLDMIGNSFDWYDGYSYFDIFAHFHGLGAFAIVLYTFFVISPLEAVGLANIFHIMLELQEYYTDAFFNTHNVQGTFDVEHDLLAGLLGSFAYMTAYKIFVA